jgi:thiosulfate/3-mercaptopyruvate sulfurtransferase
MGTLSRRAALLTLSALGASIIAVACRRPGPSGENAAAPLPRLPPGDLAARIDQVREGKLDVLHVGPAYLFGKSHVLHARHSGEASTDAGYATLLNDLRQGPLDREVILYCGCCPTKNCPNIAPAERAAREVGLRRAAILDLPTTLKADWTDHGYPVDKA